MSDNKKSCKESIAIIGMACVYPGAHTPEELWENVLSGRRFFRKAPPERLPRSEYCDPDPETPGKSYCDQLALITDWVFDPLRFGIPPITVEASDICHWLALSTAQSAIEDAHLDLHSVDRARTGVILGNSLVGEYFRSVTLRYRAPYVERSLRRALTHLKCSQEEADAVVLAMAHFFESPLPRITEDTLAGNMSNTIAGRICGYYDFGAGGYTVDGACSSSLLAIAHACQALVVGDMDVALAGGVDVSLDPFEIVGFAKAKALANEDIWPYDERASGMLPGEGCGVVVLATEEYARAKGYPIHAFIRGWGYSSDGTGNITAPKIEGQVRALRKTYERAGYPISTVGLLEGHGTGTILGDKVEITALRQLIEESTDGGASWLGSIKGNIGHCKAAAGVAGIIKSVMALKRKMLPPSGNCERPNHAFGRPMGRLRPTARGTIWPQTKVPRRASVSAMGFGGANSHITLEEANPESTPMQKDLRLLGSQQKSEVIFLSAATKADLLGQIQRLIPVADAICRAELTDLSAALAKTDVQGDIRFAIVTNSPWGLYESLRQASEKLSNGVSIPGLNDPDEGIFAGIAKKNPVLGGLFPGQASQRLNMMEHLLRRYPFVHHIFERADWAVENIIPGGLKSRILLNTYTSDAQTKASKENSLQHTGLAQPAIVLASVAILEVLKFLGLEPGVSVGHSLGEITALFAAGAYDGLTAIRVAALRGQSMTALELKDTGTMAAVVASPEPVADLIRKLNSPIVISNYNSWEQTVVSGDGPSIREFIEACELKGLKCRRLKVSHAFHSPAVAPAGRRFREMLQEICFSEIAGHMVSSMDGHELPSDVDIPRYLEEQIQKPVRFTEAILQAEKAYQPALWVEMGPGSVLTGLVRNIFKEGAAECMPTDLAGKNSLDLLNNVVARAYVLGFPVITERLFTHRFHRPFPLNSYNPKFIENPCERKVDAPSVSAQDIAFSASTQFKPVEADPAEFTGYLKGRRDFLKEIIGVDFKHWQDSGAAAGVVPVGQNIKIPLPKEEPGSSKAVVTGVAAEPIVSPLDFVRNWISKRTGFPLSSVASTMRFRDDLNLDSIKLGELAISVTRKFGGKFQTDPVRLANSTVQELVDALEIEAGSVDAGKDAAGIQKQMELDRFAGSDRVRTFKIVWSHSPIEKENHIDLPSPGSVLLVSDPGCARAQAIAAVLSSSGFSVSNRSSELPVKEFAVPKDLTALVIVLPEFNKLFFQCSPEEFDSRLDKLAKDLFQMFQSLVQADGVSPLRAFVFRPYQVADDCGADLDGGEAFLKSLFREYPAAQFKWIAIPSFWESGRWGALAKQELQFTGDSIGYRYSEEGQRMAAIALPANPSTKRPLALDQADVFVVTGGAKGITHELAMALARRTGIRLAILGSSQLSGAPVVEAGNEMVNGLAEFQKAGIIYRYYQCDVTDNHGVKAAIESIEQELGPVTGIFHGAGVSKLSPFSSMSQDSYLRCIRVKAKGLYNLLSAVSLDRLKALHVISSVLGRTGMQGQTDYTLANAWLDYAVQAVKKRYPAIHCLTLGYSVWAETGIGKRLGVVESLAAMGVTGIPTADGVSAYIALAESENSVTTHVVTGRLSADLERTLFGIQPQTKGRFLERPLRRVPGFEFVAEAAVSHESDLYVADHVFHGTAILPGVISMEAMTQAAMACTGRSELPVLQDISFKRPLIIPSDGVLTLRTYAVAERPAEGVSVENVIKIKTFLRCDADGFKEDHCSAQCLFGLAPEARETLPVYQEPGAPLPVSPGEVNADVLFQGKFFRHIKKIYRLKQGEESLTALHVPNGEQYFNGQSEERCVFTCPAVRDSFLQTGALVLPAGYLPVGIEELRFHKKLVPGERLLCWCTMRRQSEGRVIAELAVFDSKGELVETMRGLQLKRAGLSDSTQNHIGQFRSISLAAAETNIAEIIPGLVDQFSCAIYAVEHKPLDEYKGTFEISDENIKEISSSVSVARQSCAAANLIAARKALIRFAADHQQIDVSPLVVHLSSEPNGKPVFEFEDQVLANAFKGVKLSLSDGGGFSIAIVSWLPIGIDIEPVESRDIDVWHGLLGDDGRNLADQILSETQEPFDHAAARVWTLIEAGKKADSLKRRIPEFKSRSVELGAPWLTFSCPMEQGKIELVSAIVELPQGDQNTAALCLAVHQTEMPGEVRQHYLHSPKIIPVLSPGEELLPKPTVASNKGGASPDEKFEATVSELLEKLSYAHRHFGDDPAGPDTEANYRSFHETMESTLKTLTALEPMWSQNTLKDKQRRMFDVIWPYLGDSISFRRALEKPLGYPGDHLLMDQICSNKVYAQGLGYHFDRYALSSPLSEAVRYRSFWVAEEVRLILKENSGGRISILDLGCGPMFIERTVAQHMEPHQRLDVMGLDYDASALAFARSKLDNPCVAFSAQQANLVSPEGLGMIRRWAANCDVCICMGLIEYLEDEAATAIFEAIHQGCGNNTCALTSNLRPNHDGVPILEWFMSWWLVYRSEANLRAVVQGAGYNYSNIITQMDSTNNIVLLKAGK